jgi:hypothetical protein
MYVPGATVIACTLLCVLQWKPSHSGLVYTSLYVTILTVLYIEFVHYLLYRARLSIALNADTSGHLNDLNPTFPIRIDKRVKLDSANLSMFYGNHVGVASLIYPSL